MRDGEGHRREVAEEPGGGDGYVSHHWPECSNVHPARKMECLRRAVEQRECEWACHIRNLRLPLNELGLDCNSCGGRMLGVMMVEVVMMVA